MTGIVAAILLLASMGAATAASAGPPRPAIRGADAPSAIPGSYLVKLKQTPSVRSHGIAARARTLTKVHHGTLGQVWTRALPGFSVTMSEAQAKQLANEPDVAYVEQDQRRMGARSKCGREQHRRASG